MSEKARFLGINHVALEVGDIDEALDFYGRLFQFDGSEFADITCGALRTVVQQLISALDG